MIFYEKQQNEASRDNSFVGENRVFIHSMFMPEYSYLKAYRETHLGAKIIHHS